MDDVVGELLKQLDDLGIADTTPVMFITDNGTASNSWPNGGNQHFHGEKGSRRLRRRLQSAVHGQVARRVQ
jgi:arylsulfatase